MSMPEEFDKNMEGVFSGGEPRNELENVTEDAVIVEETPQFSHRPYEQQEEQPYAGQVYPNDVQQVGSEQPYAGQVYPNDVQQMGSEQPYTGQIYPNHGQQPYTGQIVPGGGQQMYTGSVYQNGGGQPYNGQGGNNWQGGQNGGAPRRAPKKKNLDMVEDVEKLIYKGWRETQNPKNMKIIDFSPEQPGVIIKGKTSNYESRETKNGGYLISFDIYDGSSSINVKAFLKANEYEEVHPKMKGCPPVRLIGTY